MGQDIADLEPLRRADEQRAWNWYDWANSAYYTTILTVLFAPYMITVAGRAAGCGDSADDTCHRTVSVLGLDLAAGSLPFYLTSFATIASAFLLPVVGALADRSGHKKWHMAGFAWAGSFCAALLFFMQGDHWQLGAVVIVLSSMLGGCSLVSYYAILVDISTEDERDRVSSHGWAFGYLGGGVLLALNLVMVLLHGTFGLDKELAVRLSLLSAALWWAGFTIIPVRRLRDRPAKGVLPETGGLLHRSFGQLFTTLREMRGFPMTLTFLVAFLFYNDGIQTVIGVASTYGAKQLGFGDGVLIATILLIQFVAFGGALAFGRLAGRYGAYRCILGGIYAWMAIVVLAVFLPRGNVLDLPADRGGDRDRAGRHPGAVALVLQPADPARPGGRVLRALQRLRARHLVVRHVPVRRGLPGHRVLPTRDRRPDRVLRARSGLPAARGPGSGRRRGRERAPGPGVTGLARVEEHWPTGVR